MFILAFLITMMVILMAGFPLFVGGLYFQSIKRISKGRLGYPIAASWLGVIAGINVVLIAVNHADLEGDLLETAVLSAPIVLAAFPAGVAYAMMKRRRWIALIVPAAGTIIFALIHATFVGCHFLL